MNEIHQKIELFLKKYCLDKHDLVYLVAFSGGFDSMCLLDSLKKISKNKIVAIHLNHGWRGNESDNEEENCKIFCEKSGIEFYSERLPQNIPHTETAARDARYSFFEQCADKFNSNIVFTAHNKNDNAETLVYRICNGTGISGLQGIAPNRDIYFRPLLNISRDEIEEYCKKNKLNPNFDSSNNNTNYKRNYIRAEVLPSFEKINPNIIDSINTLSIVASEETEIIEEYLNLIMNKISKDGKIDTQKFLKLSDSVQKKIIYTIYINNNLDYDREKILNIWEFIKENSQSKSGKTCSLTTDLWIFTSCSFIQIIKKETKLLPYFHITKEGEYENSGYIFTIEKFIKPVRKFPKESDNTAYVNLGNLPFDFEIRPRTNGDIIQPFGLNGTQKLKKYLNSKKIPNHEKDNLLFLVQGKEILWAINYGISDKIKVKTKPTHKIKFIEKEGKIDGN